MAMATATSSTTTTRGMLWDPFPLAGRDPLPLATAGIFWGIRRGTGVGGRPPWDPSSSLSEVSPPPRRFLASKPETGAM